MPEPGSALVIGEAIIDEFHAPDGSISRFPGGSPANVALGLARFGMSTELLTCIARDDDGAAIVETLASAGVTMHSGSFRARHTPRARVVTAPNGQPRYHFDVEWQIPPVTALPAGIGHLHVGSYSAFMDPGSEDVVAYALAAADARIRVSLDPNIRPQLIGDASNARARFEQLCRYATIVKLSDEDHMWLYPEMGITDVIRRILDLGASCVAVTQGARGSVLANAHGRVNVRPDRVDAVDAVGAGDSYMAALIHASPATDLGGADAAALRVVGDYCARAAGLTVSRRGADLPTLTDVGPFVL